VDFPAALPDAWRVFFHGRAPRAVQAQAMPALVRGASALLSGPTASGKTEAVLAPLYQRHVSFGRQQLSVVYVAPTKALVNDMYERLMGYFASSSPGIIQRYTGDHHEFSSPLGRFMLLATPEALDSLQLMRPEDLEYVRALVLDELHLLHGSARGQQLLAVNARIRARCRAPVDKRDDFQTVAMTATLREAEAVAAKWCGTGAHVIHTAGARAIELETLLVGRTGAAASLASRIRATARAGTAEKFLIFANSRNRAHQLAAALAGELSRDAMPVFFHAGVLSRSERERVEGAMKKDRRGVCVATSTLEVGIDIGDVDVVVLAEPTHSVSAFMQRIGRGNRRSSRCVVWACAADQAEVHLYECLQHCAERGEVDDAHDYHRPSVDFQQVMSAAWRGMRTESPLTRANVEARTAGVVEVDVVDDMLLTGALLEVRGALVPSDEWCDECDARTIHSVIVGSAGRSLVDVNSGDVLGVGGAEMNAGGLVYAGSGLRAIAGSDGAGVYLRGVNRRSLEPLAKLPSAGGSGLRGVSRQVMWARASLAGQDPRVWYRHGDTLVTWGGTRYNQMLAAVLLASGHAKGLSASPLGLSGLTLDVSPASLADSAREVSRRRLIPDKVASRFRETTQYVKHLSPAMAREESQRALPIDGLVRWLAECSVMPDA
jgi:ATP-dependent Lhr-like helicase